LDFEGKVQFDPIKDDDFAGFIFAYQNNTHFYLVDWKNSTRDLESTAGVNIKVTVLQLAVLLLSITWILCHFYTSESSVEDTHCQGQTVK
jgi:hypothetical protein